MPFPFEPTVYTWRDIRIEVDPRISKCKNIRSSIDICRLAMLMMMNVKFDRKQSVIVATGLVTVMSFGLRVVNQCYRIIESVCTFRTRVVLVLKILYLFTFLNFGIRLGISRHPSFLSLLTRDVTRKICFFLKLKYTVTLKRNKKNRGNWTGNRKFELFNRWLKRKFHRGTTCYVVWPSASLFSLSLSLARLFSSFLSSLARVIGHNIDTITLQSKL